MKNAIKWVVIVGVVLFLVVIAALLILPMFVDVQRYKPEIEKKVSEATGRPFNIGGELELSLFPWAGLAFSDLHLGNPPGFKEKDFVSIKSFEARIKLLPLLSRDVQIKRFILEDPRIVFEMSKAGLGNWEGIGKPSEEVPSEFPEKEEKRDREKPGAGLPITDIAVGEFAITGGSVVWIDHPKRERREISDVTLHLQDVSLDRAIHLFFSAKVDGRTLSLEGNVGPVGKDPGKGAIPLDLVVSALKQADMSLKGKIVDPATHPQFDLAFEVLPFSPRKLVAALDQSFPVSTADPKALNRVALKAMLRGDAQNVSVSGGVLDLDESRLDFTVKAKNFSKPEVTFDLKLDKIDLDGYLPPASEDKTAEEKKDSDVSEPAQEKTDYAPLRKIVVDGSIRAAQIKAHGANIQDLHLKVSGKDGLFHLDPLALNLYQGNASGKGGLDVRQDVPKTNVEFQAKGIQVGPLLQDVLNKGFVEGNVKAEVALRMEGDDAKRIKRTLNGKGDFLFRDGAIVGIDLAGMVRNVKTAFGLAEKGEEKPRTDFSEFHAPFTITNGVVNTPETSLLSPALRVSAIGKADLVKETLDFRVEPKVVASITGQGDTAERAGLMVPVLVTGSLVSPKFRPDLEGMIRKGLEEKLPQASELIKVLPGQTKGEGGSEPLEEKAKDLLKGLPFGR